MAFSKARNDAFWDSMRPAKEALHEHFWQQAEADMRPVQEDNESGADFKERCDRRAEYWRDMRGNK